ncbi:MAG: hypothetical protein CVV27_00710 [Candidatus Melainabacteria bacterium HGW-Melainabacteria-1]|nr:MAG: hypothetical protein CVV27_00710 [Candidatus Melainabacteria bacterium HGW-Melainabacteria-1]
MAGMSPDYPWHGPHGHRHAPQAAAPLVAADFMWGFSSSSYQYEDPPAQDDPMHFCTDWDLFYAARGKPAPRENGIYGWHDFDKEVAALRQMGASHYRFSIEWARVEPRPGVYNPAAIEAYVARARQLRASGIEPVVCLWHFTFPSWATDLAVPHRHGWLNHQLHRRWAPYVETMARAFGDQVSLYAPQNEVNNVARGAYLLGVFPPGQRLGRRNCGHSVDEAAALFIEAAGILRRHNPAARLLSVQNVFAWDEPLPRMLHRYVHDFHYRHLDQIAHCLDYLGFNYFTREPADPMGALRMALNAGKPGYTDLGWPIDPAGLAQVARRLYARYQLPLVVTENGLADRRDAARSDFVMAHLAQLKRIEAEGVPVHGYFHWSLADNYEWRAGFGAQFGVFGLSPDRRQLLPKPSARLYAAIIRHGWGALSAELKRSDLPELPELTMDALS